MQEPLEKYIETVRVGLKQLPADEREKEITELRQHLYALAEAGSELGDTEEAAITAAIEQFGQASTVRRRLLVTYRRRRLAAFQRSWIGAVVCTFFAWILGSVISSYTLFPLHSWISVENLTVSLWSLYAALLLECWFIGWLSIRLSGWRCLPVLVSGSAFFYCVYVAPQFRHEDMPYAIWIQTITSSTIIMAAPLLSAIISLRRSLSFRKA